MEKILFLDIDGILNSEYSCKHPTMQYKLGQDDTADTFDVNCVNRLINIIDKTGAKIVISSSWRKLFDKDEIIEYLKKHGIIGVVGFTPDLKHHRGFEIQAWLDEHKDIDKFVILDDDDDMFHLSSKLVKTDWKLGLQEKDMDKVIEMLGLMEKK